MSDHKAPDWFTDDDVIQDPYPYTEAMRAACPVAPTGHHNTVVVTGYEEALEVLRNSEDFSNCMNVGGPLVPFPVPLEGDDVTDIIAEHRHHLPMHEHVLTMDRPGHTRERALMMKMMTARRLKENADFMRRLADELLARIVPLGRCEFISAFGHPLAAFVIAELLGVPEEDYDEFREGFQLLDVTTGKRPDRDEAELDPIAWLEIRRTR